MQNIIEAAGLEKSFGKLKVLKGIGLTVSRSEVLSIMGASGAGKSTLLQILGTLSTPDVGSLVIDGINVLRLNSRLLSAFRNTKIGFVFQFHYLLPEFTAIENTMIPALIAGRSTKDARSEAESLLMELGLAERAGHKPSELSGGEQQRVAIARALVNHPAVIFADHAVMHTFQRSAECIAHRAAHQTARSFSEKKRIPVHALASTSSSNPLRCCLYSRRRRGCRRA